MNIFLQGRKKVWTTVVLVVGILVVAMGNPQFQQGNKAYEAKDYPAAIQAYQSVLDKGFSSKELHYNLGNAYYQSNQLGNAILHYEKALLLAPKDKDILYNLDIANDQRLDEISALPPFFLKRWWRTMRDFLSPNLWSIVTLLFLWIAIGGFISWLLLETRTYKKIGFFGGITVFLLAVLCLALSFSRLDYVNDSGHAILLEKEKKLHSAPDEQSPDVLTLHEGTKVQIVDQISDWYKIRLVNGEQGWLPIQVLGKI